MLRWTWSALVLKICSVSRLIKGKNSFPPNAFPLLNVRQLNLVPTPSPRPRLLQQLSSQGCHLELASQCIPLGRLCSLLHHPAFLFPVSHILYKHIYSSILTIPVHLWEEKTKQNKQKKTTPPPTTKIPKLSFGGYPYPQHHIHFLLPGGGIYQWSSTSDCRESLQNLWGWTLSI